MSLSVPGWIVHLILLLGGLLCVPTFAGPGDSFPETVSDSVCFNAANGEVRPGTATRNATVKIAKRSWVSHQIASTIVEILLKEYLGYTVILVDASGSNALLWGPEMNGGLYDVEVESWSAQRDSVSYLEYVMLHT